ncbi:hypothetical protein BDW42DRAFT_192912 [Aspergillus taichungensis]|uniref:Uncharacterized protein n=1 Tax=Aspergillus taichungensis TaxID=482145 RepID=A0A2J5HYM6_9EURO|nr:hypothetical protein BDW42DRAFT_192912 [Aspergillus taichungensis]
MSSPHDTSSKGGKKKTRNRLGAFFSRPRSTSPGASLGANLDSATTPGGPPGDDSHLRPLTASPSETRTASLSFSRFPSAVDLNPRPYSDIAISQDSLSPPLHRPPLSAASADGFFDPDSFSRFRDYRQTDDAIARLISSENVQRGVGGVHRIPSTSSGSVSSVSRSGSARESMGAPLTGTRTGTASSGGWGSGSGSGSLSGWGSGSGSGSSGDPLFTGGLPTPPATAATAPAADSADTAGSFSPSSIMQTPFPLRHHASTGSYPVRLPQRPPHLSSSHQRTQTYTPAPAPHWRYPLSPTTQKLTFSPSDEIPLPRGRDPRGRDERTYAQDLHLRSRSPKAFAPRPEERQIPSADFSDPAYHLGTFNQMDKGKRVSRVGDQERPWLLTIPGVDDDDDDDNNNNTNTNLTNDDMSTAPRRRRTTGDHRRLTPYQAARQVLAEEQEPPGPDERLPTYEEDILAHYHHLTRPQQEYYQRKEADEVDNNYNNNNNSYNSAADEKANLRHTLEEETPRCAPPPPPPPPLPLPSDGPAELETIHPTRGRVPIVTRSREPVELPVRNDGDEGDEIRMSSTAYPGQEWRPVGYSEFD